MGAGSGPPPLPCWADIARSPPAQPNPSLGLALMARAVLKCEELVLHFLKDPLQAVLQFPSNYSSYQVRRRVAPAASADLSRGAQTVRRPRP